MALKDNYITITQAAKELNVTRQTISRWVAKGDVPAEKIGREILISKKDLNKYRTRKLTENAADHIIDLWKSIATDYCRAKGYLKDGEKVDIVSSGDGFYKYSIPVSEEESLEIKEQFRPLLAGFLQGFGVAIKEINPLSKRKAKKQGGKKSK